MTVDKEFEKGSQEHKADMACRIIDFFVGEDVDLSVAVEVIDNIRASIIEAADRICKDGAI